MKQIKRIILLLLTINVLISCHKEDIETAESFESISISDSYQHISLKKRGHWGIGNNRITADTPVLCMKGNSLTVHFEKDISNLKLYLTDSDRQFIFEGTISGSKDLPYIIPVTFMTNQQYLIELSHNSNNLELYLDFITEQ